MLPSCNVWHSGDGRCQGTHHVSDFCNICRARYRWRNYIYPTSYVPLNGTDRIIRKLSFQRHSYKIEQLNSLMIKKKKCIHQLSVTGSVYTYFKVTKQVLESSGVGNNGRLVATVNRPHQGEGQVEDVAVEEGALLFKQHCQQLEGRNRTGLLTERSGAHTPYTGLWGSQSNQWVDSFSGSRLNGIVAGNDSLKWAAGDGPGRTTWIFRNSNGMLIG